MKIDPLTWAEMSWILLHQTWQIYIYRTMHINSWPIDLPNQAEMPWILLHQTWHIQWQMYIYIYIEQCTYTYGRWTPQSIKHRCLEYHYTKLGTSNGRCIYIEQCTYTHGRWAPCQLSIDALNTATPNLADLYIYRTMHIYLWQINPPCNWA